MSSHHEAGERDGKTVDILTNTHAGTRLIVARIGAEPVSLARQLPEEDGGTWRGFLWRDGDLATVKDRWNNHATVMGYYLHRIKDERSLYRGHEIRGGTHSFLRHKTFAEPEVSLPDDGTASLTYTMLPGRYEAYEYPYKLALRLTYTLEAGGELRVRFRFENQEPELITHVSFGLHPGFAVGSLADCQVLLPPGVYRRMLAPGNFLSGEAETIEHSGGPMPFAKDALPDSFILDLGGVLERTFTLVDAAGGRRTELRCQQAPYLTLWSDGHDFVAMEPCWGLPDAAQQTAFEDKPGILEVPAGGTLGREFSIYPGLLPL